MAQLEAHGTACMGIVSTVMIDPARETEYGRTVHGVGRMRYHVTGSPAGSCAALLGLFYNGENTARIV